jgi:hypothetical protein
MITERHDAPAVNSCCEPVAALADDTAVSVHESDYPVVGWSQHNA